MQPMKSGIHSWLRVGLFSLLCALLTTLSGCGGGGGEGGTTTPANNSGGGTQTAATQLVFLTQPTDVMSGSVISPGITVVLRNDRGQNIATNGVVVTMVIGADPRDQQQSASIINGTLQKTTTNGVAIFDDISIDGLGSNFSLRVQATGLRAADSQNFNVTEPLIAHHLEVAGNVADSVENSTLGSIQVRVVTPSGTLVPNATHQITASFAANPGAATLSGTTTRNAIAGIATFNNLAINNVASGYSLRFDGGALGTVDSNLFNIASNQQHLAFVQEPTDVTSGEAIPGLQVEVRDGLGNRITTSNATVQITLGTNPSAATLGGNTVVSAVNGVATFPTVLISTAGEGVTLRATSAGLVAGETQPFDVRSFAAAQADAKGSYDEADIRHFLVRTQWAVTDQAMTGVTQAGSLSNYIDSMLLRKVDSAVGQTIANAHLGRVDANFPTGVDIRRWWQELMMETDAPFQEVMSLFWHDHFALSYDVFSNEGRYMVVDHINKLRNNFAGNFRQLLFDLSVDPAMLRWLDGIQSRVGSINENFAREFWELFTLGVDNGYTQADIEEAARALTGFRERFNPTTGQNYTVYESNRHDTGNKTIFGQTLAGRTGVDGINEYWDLIDMTLQHRDPEHFIVRKLLKYFVMDDPDEDLVREFGKTFRESNWQLGPLLKRIFLSKAFYSAQAREGLVKSPVDYAFSLYRSTGLKVQTGPSGTTNVLDGLLIQSGHVPSLPPNVAGWPEGSLWLSADGMVQRANMARQAIVQRTYQSGLGIDPATLVPAAPNNGAQATVEALAQRMHITLTQAEIDKYVEYLNTDIVSSTITPQPWDPTNTSQINEKLRGLIYILANHPGFQLR